ncbi:hypothetical protein ADUPG1_008035 [Aduncisulcus paluster]|uniref:Uncharacterized protein n=1 Tax=Aduncisulcus paluster TaxID=2918883 RepID=A0ABQ5KTM6_9EUKA|nr:hypothetical protein ADUPG1_008035 [Aduncisulcus paluster]
MSYSKAQFKDIFSDSAGGEENTIDSQSLMMSPVSVAFSTSTFASSIPHKTPRSARQYSLTPKQLSNRPVSSKYGKLKQKADIEQMQERKARLDSQAAAKSMLASMDYDKSKVMGLFRGNLLSIPKEMQKTLSIPDSTMSYLANMIQSHVDLSCDPLIALCRVADGVSPPLPPKILSRSTQGQIALRNWTSSDAKLGEEPKDSEHHYRPIKTHDRIKIGVKKEQDTESSRKEPLQESQIAATLPDEGTEPAPALPIQESKLSQNSPSRPEKSQGLLDIDDLVQVLSSTKPISPSLHFKTHSQQDYKKKVHGKKRRRRTVQKRSRSASRRGSTRSQDDATLTPDHSLGELPGSASDIVSSPSSTHTLPLSTPCSPPSSPGEYLPISVLRQVDVQCEALRRRMKTFETTPGFVRSADLVDLLKLNPESVRKHRVIGELIDTHGLVEEVKEKIIQRHIKSQQAAPKAMSNSPASLEREAIRRESSASEAIASKIRNEFEKLHPIAISRVFHDVRHSVCVDEHFIHTLFVRLGVNNFSTNDIVKAMRSVKDVHGASKAWDSSVKEGGSGGSVRGGYELTDVLKLVGSGDVSCAINDDSLNEHTHGFEDESLHSRSIPAQTVDSSQAITDVVKHIKSEEEGERDRMLTKQAVQDARRRLMDSEGSMSTAGLVHIMDNAHAGDKRVAQEEGEGAASTADIGATAVEGSESASRHGIPTLDLSAHGAAIDDVPMSSAGVPILTSRDKGILAFRASAAGCQEDALTSLTSRLHLTRLSADDVSGPDAVELSQSLQHGIQHSQRGQKKAEEVRKLSARGAVSGSVDAPVSSTSKGSQPLTVDSMFRFLSRNNVNNPYNNALSLFTRIQDSYGTVTTDTFRSYLNKLVSRKSGKTSRASMEDDVLTSVIREKETARLQKPVREGSDVPDVPKTCADDTTTFSMTARGTVKAVDPSNPHEPSLPGSNPQRMSCLSSALRKTHNTIILKGVGADGSKGYMSARDSAPISSSTLSKKGMDSGSAQPLLNIHEFNSRLMSFGVHLSRDELRSVCSAVSNSEGMINYNGYLRMVERYGRITKQEPLVSVALEEKTPRRASVQLSGSRASSKINEAVNAFRQTQADRQAHVSSHLNKILSNSRDCVGMEITMDSQHSASTILSALTSLYPFVSGEVLEKCVNDAYSKTQQWKKLNAPNSSHSSPLSYPSDGGSIRVGDVVSALCEPLSSAVDPSIHSERQRRARAKSVCVRDRRRILGTSEDDELSCSSTSSSSSFSILPSSCSTPRGGHAHSIAQFGAMGTHYTRTRAKSAPKRWREHRESVGSDISSPQRQARLNGFKHGKSRDIMPVERRHFSHRRQLFAHTTSVTSTSPYTPKRLLKSTDRQISTTTLSLGGKSGSTPSVQSASTGAR